MFFLGRVFVIIFYFFSIGCFVVDDFMLFFREVWDIEGDVLGSFVRIFCVVGVVVCIG